MNHYRAAVIGCGGQGSQHAKAYTTLAETQLVAATDVSLGRATRFASLYDMEKVHHDWQEMLWESAPDVISICTPAKFHTEIVEGAVKAGVKAILCEKPMADSFEAAKRAHQAAQEAGVLLTYCHQRRFEDWYINARNLLRDGAIGELVSMEAFCSNLFDWGTHWFDLLLYFRENVQAEWVMGQIDVSDNRHAFGAQVETNGVSYLGWADGVRGLIFTGTAPQMPTLSRWTSEGIILHGTEGRLELFWRNPRLRRFGESDITLPLVKMDAVRLAVADLISCRESGKEPELSSRKALQATELIFATYESSRRRGRIVLPLDIEDNPLTIGISQGLWHPTGEMKSVY